MIELCETCPSNGECVINGALQSEVDIVRRAGAIGAELISATPCPGEPKARPFHDEGGDIVISHECANPNMVAAKMIVEMTKGALAKPVAVVA
jgi:hypothetical protein